MRIFITGASGFIGQHTIKRLTQTSHELICLVRKNSQTEALLKAGAQMVIGDITDRASIQSAMQGCQVIIHLANIYSFWEPDPDIYWQVNVEGTRHVLESALETGVEKVIYISTAAIYGKPDDLPFREESLPSPFRFSQYAESKYHTDQLAWEFSSRHNLPLVALYPGGVLGAGDVKYTGQYIQRLIRHRMPARSLQNAVQTFVHVRDVAEAIVQVLESEDALGQRYLLGKEQITIGELDRLVGEISNTSLPFIVLPDSITLPLASFLTYLANLIKKPPLWDVSQDAMRTIQVGLNFDGSKAERELGLVYTPLHTALKEAISSMQPRVK